MRQVVVKMMGTRWAHLAVQAAPALAAASEIHMSQTIPCGNDDPLDFPNFNSIPKVRCGMLNNV